MKIKWFGQSCFMITSENGTKVLMDPYKKFLGYELPELEASLVATSHNHGDHNYTGAVKGSFVHINEPGEFSEAGIEIKGIETFHDEVSGAKKGKNTMFIFKIDGINVCHCGDLGHLLDAKQIDQIGKVDILLLPVGGTYTLNADKAVKVMRQLNPVIVIPMHYRTKALGLPGLIFEKVDKFISASGLKAKEYPELDVNKENLNTYSGIAVLDYQ